MTHGSLTIEPNARVNLITGVNGSGKSSIFQAIVIGLGGTAADTKRATNQKINQQSFVEGQNQG